MGQNSVAVIVSRNFCFRRACGSGCNAGSPHARLRQALLTKNLTIIDAAAREVPNVSLADALRTLLVMAEKRDPRYERAAARWALRFISEKSLGLDESRRTLALVDVLPQAPDGVPLILRGFCDRGS